MDKTREDLLQTVTQRMMSVMRHVRHHGPPPEPPLSPPLLHILFAIARRKGEGISVKELAERSSVTPGAITQFVDALVERSLVEREGDHSDRRIVRLKLTDLAKNQLDKFRKEHLKSMSKIFDALNDDEIKQLIKLFTKLDTYHEMKDKPSAKTD
jgi:DNA-binding MarR family transcriptional regulator